MCAKRMISVVVATIVAMFPLMVTAADAPNPYSEDGWAKLPDGRKWGSTSAVDVDRSGHIHRRKRHPLCG